MFCVQDKVTLKMFAATFQAGKLERALDLVHRLNLEKSFELALRIANNHRTLPGLIEDIMEDKFGGATEEGEYSARNITPEIRKRVSEEHTSNRNVRSRA